MKGKKLIRGILLGVAGLLAVLLIGLQIALNPRVLTRIVNRIAADYVEGEVSFSRVHASVLRSFPHLNLTVDSCVVAYPHARFAAYDSLAEAGRRFSLDKAGWGAEGTDTLASFRRLTASIDYVGVLRGAYDIPHVTLSRPRIFAHRYDSTAANWNILPIGASQDTTRKPLPPVTLRRIELTDRPFIVFTDPADTLYGLFTLRSLRFDGRLALADPAACEIGLAVDSLLLSGRLPADTLALALDRGRVDGDLRQLSCDLSARTFLRTRRYGRMTVPVRARGTFSLDERPDSLTAVSVRDLALGVASLELRGEGDAVLYPDSTYIRAEASIPDCALGPLLAQFRPNFPVLRKLDTDAVVSLTALCDGCYNPARGTLPELVAELRIPPAFLDWEGLGRRGHVSLEATAETDENLRLDVDVRKLTLDVLGAGLSVNGDARDLLGQDPAFRIAGSATARVDSLTRAFTRERGISGTGRLALSLDGRARLSQLDAVHIGDATIDGTLRISDLFLRDAPDSLEARIPDATLRLQTMPNKLDPNLKKGTRVLGLTAELDTLSLAWKESVYLHGGDVRLLTHTAASVLRTRTSSLPPFMGLFEAGRLEMRDEGDLSVRVRSTRETFRIAAPAGGSGSPKLTLTSTNGRIGLRRGGNRMSVRDARFDVTARLRERGTRPRRADSLRRVRPDSLQILPAWLREADFREKDIHIDLGESARKYLREWNASGSLSLAEGRLMTPSFPLRNTLKNVSGTFDNDRIALDNVTVTSGKSDLSGQATLSGLRRGLTSGRGTYRLQGKLTSEVIDIDELLRAYAYSRTYRPDTRLERENETDSDDSYQAAIDRAELPDSTEHSLLILPANLDATLVLEAHQVHYDSLHIDWASSDIALRQRCLQITNTVATSNMGDIYFEGFYATRNRDDLRAGFDLNLVDITAEKVITLMPAVDTLMPMLKSFGGLLDCELAATSYLDEHMNLVLPTLDGVLKISGKNLSLRESEQFAKIAKLLMFKNKSGAYVDRMAVSGMVRDNTLEIFPFVVDIDRYTFAASGIQHFDESYNYHISVIKSPIPFKFGLNIFGNDFDQMKFRVGRAKYRTPGVPVFTTQINEVQLNLVQSIHNIFDVGVERAIRENEAQALIARQKEREGYSAEEGTGDLSPEEEQELEKARNTYE